MPQKYQTDRQAGEGLLSWKKKKGSAKGPTHKKQVESDETQENISSSQWSTYSVGEETNVSQTECKWRSWWWVSAWCGNWEQWGAQACSCWNPTVPRMAPREGRDSPAQGVWMWKYFITVAFILLLFSSSEKFQFLDRKALRCCCHWLTSCHLKCPLMRSGLPLPWLTFDWKQQLEGGRE